LNTSNTSGRSRPMRVRDDPASLPFPAAFTRLMSEPQLVETRCTTKSTRSRTAAACENPGAAGSNHRRAGLRGEGEVAKMTRGERRLTGHEEQWPGSLRRRSAARSMSERLVPWAIAATVPIEQGQITIPAVFADPEAARRPILVVEHPYGRPLAHGGCFKSRSALMPHSSVRSRQRVSRSGAT